MNFLKKIEKHKKNICFINEKNKNYSYENIITKSEKLTENLKERSLIFVLAQNHIDFFISYIGCFRKGLVQMLLDPKIASDQLNDLLKAYEPKYIFIPNLTKLNLKNYTILQTLGDHKILELNKNNFFSLNKNLSLLLSTSGSTGSKKFVRISYDNIYQNTKSIIRSLNIKKKEKTITTMPPFYTYGLSVINTHLFAGASILITNQSAVEKNFWTLIKDKKITSFAGVPYFYEILNKIKFDKIKLPNLRYFTQAGGALRKDLINYFLNYSKKNNKKFIIMYGQTEATSRMTYLPYEMSRKKIGSVGKPINGGKIYLLNNKLKNSSQGEIVYKGKNVSLGYAKNYKDLSKNDINKGVLRTGDIGKKDKEGYLYIVGRKSRDIKLFGHRISLDGIEEILIKKGYNCLCHEIKNRVMIFHSDNGYNDEIINYISKITKIHHSCFKLKYIKKFPKSENGKVLYKELENTI
jgi:long-chain acyl-CoA synthetase